MEQVQYQEHYFLFQVAEQYYAYSLPTIPVTQQVIEDVLTHMKTTTFQQIAIEHIKVAGCELLTHHKGTIPYLVQYMNTATKTVDWMDVQVTGGIDNIEKVAEVLGFILNETHLADGEIVILSWRMLHGK